MAIEFECQGCQKTLRVPDEFAGRKAKCPNCQTILQVPGSSETAEPSQVQPPIESSPDLFAGLDSSDSTSSYEKSPTADRSPFASSNPYASPQPQPPPASRSRFGGAPHRGGLVLGLGIGSIVTCNLCFILGSLSLVLGLLDLQAMKAGRMDNAGFGLTLTGTIMGGVMTGISLLFFTLRILVMAAG